MRKLILTLILLVALSFTVLVGCDRSGGTAVENSLPKAILDHFTQTQEDAFENEIDVSMVHWESKDVDQDGSVEWFVYTSMLCGSGGCSAPVYSRIDGEYCFVAWGHSTDFKGNGVAKGLNCRDINSPERVFLEDLMK